MKVSSTSPVPVPRASNPFSLNPGQSVRRRVDAVVGKSVVVDGVVLPKNLLPKAKVGQWVSVSMGRNGIELKIDLKATLVQESRMNDLFMALTR